MACDSAAGKQSQRGHQLVIMIGRNRSTAPSTAASSMVWPRARSWLMYSSMITPVCTETPNSARNPTPEETLKCVWVSKQRQHAAQRRHHDVHEDQQTPI